MDLKIVVTMCLLLAFVTPAFAASSNISEETQAATEGLAVKAVDAILMSFADALNSFWQDSKFIHGTDSTNETDEYGVTRTSIMNLVSVNIDPSKIKEVEDFNQKSVYVWALLVVIVIFGVPIMEVYARSHPGTFQRTFGTKHYTDEEYVGTSFLCICSYAAPDFVLLVLLICSVLGKYLMLNVMDYIEPSLDNAWMYVFMAVGDALLAVFYLIRPWVICIVYPASRFLALWYFTGFWREEVSWVWNKFFKIASMQPVTIFITCICLITIKWAGLEDGAGVYIIMFLFLAYVDYKYLTGGWGLNTIKRYAMRRM